MLAILLEQEEVVVLVVEVLVETRVVQDLVLPVELLEQHLLHLVGVILEEVV